MVTVLLQKLTSCSAIIYIYIYKKQIHSGYSAPLLSEAGCEFPRNRLVIERVVGTGAFGVVCRGNAFNLPGLTGWTTVAIKTVPGKLQWFH